LGTENVVSIEIAPEDDMTMTTNLENLRTVILKYAITLSPEQRRDMAKMSDKTYPFVEKISEYIVSHPEFIPAFMDTAEFNKDFAAARKLKEHQRLVEQLNSSLIDTIMLCGSEAYKAALAYYNAVKQAAKMNVQAAADIYSDLRKRFAGQGAK